MSGRAAGYLFGALEGLAPPPEVTAPTERRIKGIKTLHPGDHANEAEVRHGIRPAQVEAVTRAALPRLAERGRAGAAQTNRPAGGHYVDCRWPEQRLTVELDSSRYTPGSRTAAASVRPEAAPTNFAATPGATSSNGRTDARGAAGAPL